jgi:hypothetical protein
MPAIVRTDWSSPHGIAILLDMLTSKLNQHSSYSFQKPAGWSKINSGRFDQKKARYDELFESHTDTSNRYNALLSEVTVLRQKDYNFD